MIRQNPNNPVPADQLHVLHDMLETLTGRGYYVERLRADWAMVTKDDTVVQLEVDNPGANLDIILLSRETGDYDIKFPLGGSWATKSSVKLTECNVNFGVARIEAFYGVVKEGDRYGAQVWEDVQRSKTGKFF